MAKRGELASFHCCQQGLLLSSKGIHLLSHIFICLVFSIQNAEESPEAFHFKCLSTSLCLSCQNPALASLKEYRYKCSVEFKLCFDVSALPDGVKSNMATAILVLISFVEVPSLPKLFERVYFLKVLTIHHAWWRIRKYSNGSICLIIKNHFLFTERTMQRHETGIFLIPDSPDSTPPSTREATDTEMDPTTQDILPRSKLIQLLLRPHDGVEQMPNNGPYSIEPSQLVRLV